MVKHLAEHKPLCSHTQIETNKGFHCVNVYARNRRHEGHFHARARLTKGEQIRVPLSQAGSAPQSFVSRVIGGIDGYRKPAQSRLSHFPVIMPMKKDTISLQLEGGFWAGWGPGYHQQHITHSGIKRWFHNATDLELIDADHVVVQEPPKLVGGYNVLRSTIVTVDTMNVAIVVGVQSY